MIRTVRKLTALLLTLALTLTLLPAGLRVEAAAGGLIQKGKKLRLLAVGNSFSVDALEHLYKMAESAGYDVTIGNLYISSCTLATHWNNLSQNNRKYIYYEFDENNDGSMTAKENESIQMALDEQKWDVITFQQASGDSGRPATYKTFTWSNKIDIMGQGGSGTETAMLSAPAQNPALRFLTTWTGSDDTEEPEEDTLESVQEPWEAPGGEEPEEDTSEPVQEPWEASEADEPLQNPWEAPEEDTSGDGETEQEQPASPDPDPEGKTMESVQPIQPQVPALPENEEPAQVPALPENEEPAQVPALPENEEPAQMPEPQPEYQESETDLLPQEEPVQEPPAAFQQEETPVLQREEETLLPQEITCETALSGVGKTFPLRAKAKTNLSYVSSNPKAVAVDQEGNVTLKGDGKAVVTITAEKTKEYSAATAKVTVNSKATTYMNLLADEIRNIYEGWHGEGTAKKLKFGWHMTWAYSEDPQKVKKSFQERYEYYNNSQTTMYNAITKTVQDVVIPTGLFAFYVPSGTAIQNLRTSYVGDNLNRDGVHLSLGLGRYAAAMTWAATLGINVNDITYLPPGSNGVNARERAVVRNAVTNAVKTPWSVTKSTYTAAPKLKKAVLKVPVNTASGLKLTWDKVSGAEGYQIYRKAGAGEYSLIKTVSKGTVETYTDTAVKDKTGVLYTYYVKSWYTANYSGKKVYSVASNTARMTRLNPPAKVAVPVNQTGGLKLTWSKVAGASGYRVYRKAGSGKFALIKTIDKGTTLSYLDAAVKQKSGITYTYYLTAYATDKSTGTKGYSVASAQRRQIRLMAPGKVKAVNTAAGLKLTWDKAGGAGGYQVYRKAGAGKYALIKTLSKGTAVACTDTAVKDKTGTLYTYCVKSWRTVSGSSKKTCSAASNTARMTRLNPPAKVKVPVNQAGGLRLAWSKVAGASGYRVYRKAGSGKFALVKTIDKGTTLSYLDAAVEKKSGTTYTYYLTAYATDKSTGTKGYSVASAQRRQTRLAAPGKVKAANAAAGIKLTWSKVGAAQGYRVYRWTGKEAPTCLAKVKKGVLTYTDRSVKDKNGSSYTYYVMAYSKLGMGTPSAEQKMLRLVPAKMKGVKQSGAQKVQVTWSRNKAAAGYTLYRRKNSGKWKEVRTVTSNSTLVFTDQSVKAGNTYSYCLRAHRGTVTSVPSNTVKVKVRKLR